MEKGVKLVGFWVSPFVQRVKWALALKGIEYEYIEEDVFNKTPNLLSRLNPVHGKVPVLIHDGNPIPESFIILEYIDQTWNNNPLLLPHDPFERAHFRFWAKVVEEKLFYSSFHALCSQGEEQDKAVRVSIKTLEEIETMLKGKTFFGGNTIGFLDLMMGFASYLLPVWEEVASVKILDPLKFPGIAAWKDNFINHDVIKGVYLPTRPDLISYFQWRRSLRIPV